MRGFVPVSGRPIPVAYYHSSKGNFVRAEITYLKQDFSLMHPVTNHGVWPSLQRFDYLVRKRKLSPAEVEESKATKQASASYPQRDAVAWALTKLAAAGD